jgi:hypothetical protein
MKNKKLPKKVADALQIIRDHAINQLPANTDKKSVGVKVNVALKKNVTNQAFENVIDQTCYPDGNGGWICD